MPLDVRKIAPIQQVIPQTWNGRQRTVTFVYPSNGVMTCTPVSAMLKLQRAQDPAIPEQRGRPPLPAETALER